MELGIEQIKCYARVYLYIFTEGDSMQIANFIRDNLNIDVDEYFDVHKVLAKDRHYFKLRKRGDGRSVFRLNI